MCDNRFSKLLDLTDCLKHRSDGVSGSSWRIDIQDKTYDAVIVGIVKKIESTYGFDLSPEGFVFILRDAATGEEIGRLTTDENGKVVSVKTAAPVPKEKMLDVMKEINIIVSYLL